MSREETRLSAVQGLVKQALRHVLTITDTDSKALMVSATVLCTLATIILGPRGARTALIELMNSFPFEAQADSLRAAGFPVAADDPANKATWVVNLPPTDIN